MSNTANTNTDLRNGVNGDVGCKYPCLVATMINITLEGEQTVNGIAVSENDIVLVNGQTNKKENGIYVVSTGEWQRGVWFNSQLNVAVGSLVYTLLGTQRSNTIWVTKSNTNPINFGTSEITFDYVAAAGAGFLLASNNLSDVDSASQSRINLGLEIGVNIQAQNANLEAIAGLVSAADKVPVFTGAGTASLLTTGIASGDIPLVGTQSATTSLAGLSSLAVSSEVRIGTDANKAITPLALAGAMLSSKTANGYTYLPNGIILQWGRTNSTSINGTVTLPIAYPNQNFGVVLGEIFNSPGGDSTVRRISGITTSSFDFRSDNAGAYNDFYWFSIGY